MLPTFFQSAAAALSALALAGSASSAEILVTADIATSTTWTANNVYNLQSQIYVLPGATLTIEPGTRIASTTGLGGSLAVARGAQIFALGQRGAPIVFTSTADDGTWREAANEWGNLTLMGAAYVSANAIPTNTPTPSASNVADMEGLAPPTGSALGRYGGGNDDDDSGVLRYVSLRFGGRVLGLGNELNGLSLGGIGRGTDIDHVEVMNNVDDGIEIWGGTVDLKYFSIWNVGDDSLDIDQGWRGRAQFGLIVQGYCLDASQGSGVGDNAIEMDGAEDADWQPVTTATLYNLTVIGQPIDGDGTTAWRDGARVQLRNCVFMDGGEEVVRADLATGTTGGYGLNGTLTFAEVWSTPYTATSTVNAPPNPSAFYRAQFSGTLAEISDSVFFRNFASNAYAEATARGVFDPVRQNLIVNQQPIVTIQREAPVTRGGKQMARVRSLDPRPAADALVSASTAPTNGFYTLASYRGAFAPGTQETWLAGWSAAEEFGFVTGDGVGVGYCTANASSTGQRAQIRATGSTTAVQNDLTLEAGLLPPNVFGFFLASRAAGFVANPAGSAGNLCLGGSIGRFVGPGQIMNSGPLGLFVIDVDVAAIPQPNGPAAASPGDVWYFQAWFRDNLFGSPTSNFTGGVGVTFD